MEGNEGGDKRYVGKGRQSAKKLSNVGQIWSTISQMNVVDGGSGPEINAGSTISQGKWMLPEMWPRFVRDIDNQPRCNTYNLCEAGQLKGYI